MMTMRKVLVCDCFARGSMGMVDALKKADSLDALMVLVLISLGSDYVRYIRLGLASA